MRKSVKMWQPFFGNNYDDWRLDRMCELPRHQTQEVIPQHQTVMQE